MSQSDAAMLTAMVAAAIAFLVGGLQVAALSQQNKIAAFDKRFAAFLRTQEALQRACVETQKPSIEDIFALNPALQECWFLFPKHLANRLYGIRRDILKMRALHADIWDDLGTPLGACNETLNEFHKAQLAAVAEWESLRETFHPHMNLDFWASKF